MIFQSSMTFRDFSRNFFQVFQTLWEPCFVDDILNYIFLTEKDLCFDSNYTEVYS